MPKITEQQISALASNPAAAANGRKISASGGFVRREKSSDDTFYLGECTGSGKSNYITTGDFIEEGQPVMRCSCPSRQFPCKHGIALLYEIMADKNFAVCDIPDDILQKREKKRAKDQKTTSGSQKEQSKKAAPSVSNSAKSARTKKIRKQLEGLELTEKLLQSLLNGGLGTMAGADLKDYRQTAKQLGDYYLTGPQQLLNRLILEIAAYQKDGDERRYETGIQILKRLWSLIKKSTKYLSAKLEDGEVLPDDSSLYEELGGIWKLSELESMGRNKDNASFAQLSFWVEYDEAAAQYVDISCYDDLETGEISLGKNYRPLKALKYIRQEDSVFDKLAVPSACYYPGEGNLRV